MAKRKREKVEQLVGQLIKNELEAQLSRMVRKARKRATKEAGKLNEMLQLEYRRDQGFAEAEFEEIPPGEDGQNSEVKKTEDQEQNSPDCY